jgi:hypothetical protein
VAVLPHFVGRPFEPHEVTTGGFTLDVRLRRPGPSQVPR